MLSRAALLLLAALLVPVAGARGAENMWTSAAFTADPATCASTYPTTCDDSYAAKLTAFPYWQYRMSSGASISGTFLGVANGYLWGVLCNHCVGGTIVSNGTAQFASGPWAGQTFVVVPHPCGGYASAQFGMPTPCNSPNPPTSYLMEFRPQTGETLPNVPMMRTLRNRWPSIPDDAFVIAMGTGGNATDPTLGWFKECALTAAGGDDGATGGSGADLPFDLPVELGGAGRNACCTDARVADQYEGYTGGGQIQLPMNNGGATHVAYGGEGNFASCTAAGLTYIGSTWGSGGWNWRTRLCRDPATGSKVTPSWRSADVAGCLLFNPDTSTLPGRSFPLMNIPGRAAAVENGYADLCITWSVNTIEPHYTAMNPPVTRIKHHEECGYDGSSTHTTVNAGDSGSQYFVYVNNLWYYVGSGSGGAGSMDMAQWWGQFANAMGISGSVGGP